MKIIDVHHHRSLFFADEHRPRLGKAMTISHKQHYTKSTDANLQVTRNIESQIT